MLAEIIFLILGLVIGIFLTKIIITNKLKLEFKDSEKQIRERALSGSRRSLVGKFIERFVPFLSSFNYSPADSHFLGQPIDYIVFDGLKDDDVKKVVFVEVKSGKSSLTKREKSLKKAIESKEVYWEEIRVDTEDLDKLDLENN